MTGKEAFEKYVQNLKNKNKSEKTIETYKSALNKFFLYFSLDNSPIEKVESIGRDDFETFIFSFENLSVGSKNTIIRSINPFLNYLLDLDIISKEQISRTKFGKGKLLDKKKKAVVTLTVEEINKIIDAAGSVQDKFMFELMLGCGLRENEVCELKPEDFKGDGYFEFVGKGGDEYKLRMSDRLTQLFEMYKTQRDTSKEYLFYPRSGRGSKNEKLYSKTPNTRLKAAMVKTDIPLERQKLITSHTLRKTMITTIIEVTESIEVARQAARHKNVATTYLYNNAIGLGVEAMRNLDVRKSNME